jgi:hypothetical protein
LQADCGLTQSVKSFAISALQELTKKTC